MRCNAYVSGLMQAGYSNSFFQANHQLSSTTILYISNSNLTDRLIDWLNYQLSLFSLRDFLILLCSLVRSILWEKHCKPHSLQLKNTNWINRLITNSLTHSFTRPNNSVFNTSIYLLCFPVITPSFFTHAGAAAWLKWTQYFFFRRYSSTSKPRLF